MITKVVLFFVMITIMFVAAIIIGMLGAFRSRLGIRIALIIMTVGPLLLIEFVGFNVLVHAPWWARLLQMLIIIIGGPLFLGLLASRYVTGPLNQFNTAISSLTDSNYHVELKRSGIREFDKVFIQFNELTKRLRREEELRKNLISDTSHELNTPIAAIMSQLTAMEDGVLPITKKRVQGLARQTERLSELVSQLNEYTRARATTGVDHKEAVRFQDFCTEIVQAYAVQLREHHMRLQLDMPEEYVLQVNRRALERILNNILQNALRYSHADTLTIQASGQSIRIQDNGRGVPEDSLPYLFERFYRVETSRNRTTGGLGLGLSIVRELVERQGWQIHAEDAHPGLAIVISFKNS